MNDAPPPIASPAVPLATVEIEDGKYRFVADEGGNLSCTRHGHPWWTIATDGAALALVKRAARAALLEERIRQALRVLTDNAPPEAKALGAQVLRSALAEE